MGNSITISFNHPLDRSQEIVIYPEIKKRPRPSQVERDGVKQSALGVVQGSSSSTQDRSLLQSIGNSSQTFGKQEVDRSTSHDKVQSPKEGETDSIVDEKEPIQKSRPASVATSSLKQTKPSNKWWRRLFSKKNIPKETISSCQEASFLQNTETASVVDASVTSQECIKKNSAQREEMHKGKKEIALHEKPKTKVNGKKSVLDRPIEDQRGPSGSHGQHIYGKASVVKRHNNILQNKNLPSSSKQVSKNVPLPRSRFETHSTKNENKLNQNLPSSSRQRSNNFSYNLRELPLSRLRKDDSSRKHQRDSDQKPPLPSNQNRREPPRPTPPTRTGKDTSFGQSTTVKNEKPIPLPSQQNTSKYRTGLLKPSRHQAPVPPKRQREDHRSWQNIGKHNQEPPPLPSNQNSRTRGKKPPSHCVRSNVDYDSHRRPPIPPRAQPLNEFNFRQTLWMRELEPRIIRVPDSRTSIPGTSLEEKARYNHVKKWILSVQQHFRMTD